MNDSVVTKKMLNEALTSFEKRIVAAMKEMRKEFQEDIYTLFQNNVGNLSESVERLAISTAHQFTIVHEELNNIKQDIRDIQLRQFR